MIIDGVEVVHVAMPLIYPWRTAYGADPVIESVLVKFTSGSNVAWGEACTLGAPTYSPEHAAGIFCVLKEHFVNLVVGKEFDTSEDLQYALRWFKGNQFAKAALDTAWWGLRSIERGCPLQDLFAEASGLEVADSTGIGCHPTKAFAVGADFGVRDSIEELLELVGEAIEMGAPRIKLKCAKGWDTEMLTAIRKRFPPPIVFHIDCNGGYDLKEDMEFLSSLDQYELAMIEQPLNPTTGGNAGDLLDHAELASIIKTPICLDESINSLRSAERAIELGSAQVFNIKPGRCGGVTTALQIMALAKQHSIPCWIGGMLESAVGAEFCKALATLENCSYPADIFPSSKFYVQDLSSPDIQVWSEHVADGRKVTVTSASTTPHLTKPIPAMLRRSTVSAYQVYADGSGGLSTGLLGDALRKGEAKL